MLELRVSSPRILLCDAMKMTGRAVKWVCIGLIFLGLGFGVHLGWQKLFVENHEYALREMPLETPSGEEPMFMTRARVIAVTEIDPSASIFAADLDEMEERLEALPDVAGVEVSRRLPGTLRVKFTERVPVAWLACPSLGLEERSVKHGLLVDASGYVFPCVTHELAKYAEGLPLIFANELPKGAITSGEKLNHEGLDYALSLILKADADLSDLELPDWVMVVDGIRLKMRTVGGTEAIFSYFDQGEQLAKLRNLSAHARESGRELETINLIPNRYVPVTYRRTR